MTFIKNQSWSLRRCLHRVDGWLVGFIKQHSNLLAVFVAASICMWMFAFHYAWAVIGILVIGGLSYFFGLATAMVFSFVICIWSWFSSGVASPQIPVAMTELVGYLCVSWLGYQHQREERHLEHQRMTNASHKDQVMSWTVVNEVRTSLAAIRFLLFPVHDEKSHEQLQAATKELSRLEHMFQEIEKQDPQGDGDRHTV